MVTRRSLIRAVGLVGIAGLAGCTARGDDPLPDGGDDGDGTGSAPTDREVPPDATHRVSVTAQDDPPELPVTPRVSVADPFATGGSPPVLRVDVDNTSDAPVVLGEYRAVVFQYVSDGEALILLPHSERSTSGDPDRATPDYGVEGEGCWRLTDRIAVTQEYGTVELPAGGTLTAYVGLYGLPDAGDCLPTGDHRFGTTYSYYPDGLDGDGREDATWGFSLAVDTVEDGA